MTREQVKLEVMSNLAAHGIVCVDGTMIVRKTIPSHMSGDDLVIYQIHTKDHDVHDYCQEDLLEAINDFLNLNKHWYAAKEKHKITVDAETLRQQNFEASEAVYNQWCEEPCVNNLLAEIEDKILTANDAGKRTMDVDIPREDQNNFVRFFKARHFDAYCQEYSSANTEKVGKALLKLDWSGKPKQKKKVDTQSVTKDLGINPIVALDSKTKVPTFHSKEDALAWILSNCRLVSAVKYGGDTDPVYAEARDFTSTEEFITWLINH